MAAIRMLNKDLPFVKRRHAELLKHMKDGSLEVLIQGIPAELDDLDSTDPGSEITLIAKDGTNERKELYRLKEGTPKIEDSLSQAVADAGKLLTKSIEIVRDMQQVALTSVRGQNKVAKSQRKMAKSLAKVTKQHRRLQEEVHRERLARENENGTTKFVRTLTDILGAEVAGRVLVTLGQEGIKALGGKINLKDIMSGEQHAESTSGESVEKGNHSAPRSAEVVEGSDQDGEDSG